jgi:signal transduction histidine kinase
MLRAGGEMASRIAAFDWRTTPLGPIESWPVALRTTVAVVLENRFPMTLLWGRDLRNIHNDAYIPVLGSKHPAALGRPVSEIWSEIWPIVRMQLHGVLNGKGATWNEHLLLPIIRRGFLEETYFTFSFGPVRDDAGAIGGVLATCYETTIQIQDERQLQMLRELGAEGSGAASAEAACATAARILAGNDADVPFSLIYLLRSEAGDAELVASTGLDGYEGAGKPARISFGRRLHQHPHQHQNDGWPLSEAAAPGRLMVVDDLPARFGAMPGGRWETPPQQAVVLGLVGAGMTEPYGFLIAGVSPLRVLDQRYQRMYRLTVDSIATAVGAARLRAQAERERARFFLLLKQAPTPIAVYDGPELRVMFQNDAAKRLGPLPDDPIGKPVAEAFPQVANQPSTVALRQVYETGRGMSGPHMRLRLPDATGVLQERTFDLRREPMRDENGKVTGVISVAFEITEQVLAQRQLEASEQRYRAIFEMAQVSIWEEDFSGVKRLVDELKAVHGADLRRVLTENPALVQQAIGLVRIRDVNPATLRMFGAASKEQLTSSLSRIFVPSTAAVFLEEMLAMAEGKKVVAYESPLRTLSGEPIDVAFTLSFAQDDDAYERALVTLTDVSPQSEARREREARIGEMEQAVRFGEMFIGIVGHDLRNPLSAITTAAGLLRNRADSERIASPARRVIASADRMERMISQLLDFTRIRLGGGLLLERTDVDLAEVARSIVDELEPVHHREIHVNATGNVVGLWDRDRLCQLLSNLVANACQHGAPGTPVEILLDGTEPVLVRIVVTNRGVIPPELVPVLFEPLRRTSADRGPTRGGSSGLGLGLYITEQITLAHGGRIHVESTDAEGTRFIVELPPRA